MPIPAVSHHDWVTHPWVRDNAAEVRFGIANGPRGDWPALREFASAAEELGFDAFWSSDHPVLSPGCWTTLAALAATTRRIRLGSLVACIDYLHPVVLARTALDIDQISGGRLVLGLGIGDFEHEYAQMSIPWRSTKERQATLGALVELLRYLWGDQPKAPTALLGIDAPPLRPGPSQRPRIPILIAGGGERITLRQVAQYADASNFGEHAYTGGVQEANAVLSRMQALERHCAAFGRPSDSVLRTHTTYPLIIADSPSRLGQKLDRFLPSWVREITKESLVAGTPEVVAAHFNRLVGSGLQHFIAFVYGNDLDTMRLLAEQVVPEVRRFRAETLSMAV
jgi:alkanesulfonate monooxygenase SsuD/methylene tetrahydromethanopterin reductase-like flavin-dependent oxidoreductase (luciferase family)